MKAMKRARPRVPLKKRILGNYHWIIAAVTLLMLFIYGGAANNFSSLHIDPVSADLKISGTTFSLIYSIKSIMAMIASFFSGAILKKFGFRYTASFFLLISTVGYICLSVMKTPLVLVLVCFAMGAASSFCGTTGATNIISDWFHRHRGTVLGFVSAATGLGGSVMCIAQSAAMKRFTWRGSFMLCGICCGVITLLAFLILRNKPRDMGLEAYGEGEEITGKRRRISERAFPGMPMEKLSRSPSFYLMLLCTFLSCLGIYLAFNTIFPFLNKDCNYGEDKAASLQSAMMLLFTGTKLLVGFFSDRIGAAKVNTTCVIFGAASLLLLALSKTYGYGLAWVAVVLYTVSIPLVTITVPLLAFSLFGYKAQTQYTGKFIAAIYAASFLASPLSNLIRDLFGSYQYAYFLAAAILAADLFLYLLLYKMAKRDNQRYSSAE
ncbi:MAG: MFS transporter [Ruminococcaceae bacterium]|nr:MFS transporter [Oscillospiraceae bacterium]